MRFLLNDSDLERDLIVNLSTEGVGVIVSVFLSILFARWLDDRAQRRIFRNRVIGLQKHLSEVHSFLTTHAFSNERYMPDEQYPTMDLHKFRSDYFLLKEDFVDYARNVRVDYVHLVSDDTLKSLDRIRRNLDNAIACFGLRSAQFRRNVADGISVDDIARDQADWASAIIDRLEVGVRDLENNISWLPKLNLRSDKDELQKKYKDFFLPFIPRAIKQLQEL